MDNFKIIYRILRFLEKAMDLEEVDTDRTLMVFRSSGLRMDTQKSAFPLQGLPYGDLNIYRKTP